MTDIGGGATAITAGGADRARGDFEARRVEILSAELLSSRAATEAAVARYKAAVADGNLLRLADAAEELVASAGRAAGFARMLFRVS